MKKIVNRIKNFRFRSLWLFVAEGAAVSSAAFLLPDFAIAFVSVGAVLFLIGAAGIVLKNLPQKSEYVEVVEEDLGA